MYGGGNVGVCQLRRADHGDPAPGRNLVHPRDARGWTLSGCAGRGGV